MRKTITVTRDFQTLKSLGLDLPPGTNVTITAAHEAQSNFPPSPLSAGEPVTLPYSEQLSVRLWSPHDKAVSGEIVVSYDA